MSSQAGSSTNQNWNWSSTQDESSIRYQARGPCDSEAKISYAKKCIRLAEEVIKDRMHFRKSFGTIFDGKHKSALPSTTQEDLEGQIAREESKLREEAQSVLGTAVQIHQNYREERTRGTKKIGYKAQNFIKCFASFLSAYSAIVDLVRGAGQIYGEAAYETLSVLFFVSYSA